MAAVRPNKTGRFELTITNKRLPKGRAYFTFDTEAEARTYGDQAEKWLAAGLVPPDLAADTTKDRAALLGPLIRTWASSGSPAASEQAELTRLYAELGALPLASLNYAWAEAWITSMKLHANLAPSTIRRRVQALAKAIDAYLRRTPDAPLSGNPLRLLPQGYSTYTPGDRAAVTKAAAAGADVRVRTDQVRDRRLAPDEEVAIRQALAGVQRADRERALQPDPEFALLFELLLQLGLRLREAYRLRVDQVDLQARVVRPQASKLWHGRVAFRAVPLPPPALAALQQHLASRGDVPRPERVFPRLWDGDTSEAALRRTTVRLTARFRTLFAYAGVDGLTEHDLRHEATCRWFEMRGAGGQWLYRAEEIVRIMGWTAGSRMVLRYASFRPEDLAGRMYLVSDQARVA